MAIEVQKATTKRELRAFIDLPWEIYKNYPHWVPPLKEEVEKMVTPGKYPFWNHAARELFIARKEGKVAGRIAAIRDDHHDRVHGEKAGFFGFFESVEDYDVARALFDAAKAWCKAKGCEFLRGPASPSANDEYGFLLEGFDKDPAVIMPYNPEYYLRFSEQYGFAKTKDLYALLKIIKTGIPPRIEKIMQRAKKPLHSSSEPLIPKTSSGTSISSNPFITALGKKTGVLCP